MLDTPQIILFFSSQLPLIPPDFLFHTLFTQMEPDGFNVSTSSSELRRIYLRSKKKKSIADFVSCCIKFLVTHPVMEVFSEWEERMNITIFHLTN